MGGVGKGKVHPSWGYSSPENFSVPLPKDIYSSVFDGRLELSLCHYFTLLAFHLLVTVQSSPLTIGTEHVIHFSSARENEWSGTGILNLCVQVAVSPSLHLTHFNHPLLLHLFS